MQEQDHPVKSEAPSALRDLHALYPFIHDLTTAGRMRLAQALTWQTSSEGQSLVVRGDKISGVYLVQKGNLRVFSIDEDGREATLYWVGPRDTCILAINCMFAEVDYPAWVSADSPTSFAVVPAQTFRALFESEPAVQRFAFDGLSGRLFELVSMLTESVSFRLEQRLASLLLRRADSAGMIHMSQETMANHLGTAREVVSRAARNLAAQGLLNTRRGAVEIKDIEGLRSLIS